MVGILNQTAAEIRKAIGLSPEPENHFALPLPSKGRSLRFYAEGLQQLELSNAKSAASFLEQALVEDETSFRILLALSRAYAQLGERTKAEAKAQQALAVGQDLDRRSQLTAEANTLEIQQKWQEAAEIFQAL